MAKQKPLVCQHLESVSRDVLGKYKDIIREYVGRRHGVYALYRGSRLHYVGLASNLRSRLANHLRDRHANTWDHFSIYLTLGDEHLKELESLVLRITSPKGNRQKGKFRHSEDLRRPFRRQIAEYQRLELDRVFGPTRRKHAAKLTNRVKTNGRTPTLARHVTRKFPIRLRYKGRVYKAGVRSDGTINFRGRIFTSPSVAAAAIYKHPMDGWHVWKYQRAPGDWVPLDELRR